jgi:protoheme IX farnesyltransferase
MLMIYLELAKARLTALVLLTALVGFLLASASVSDPLGWPRPVLAAGGWWGWRLVWMLVGTGLAAAGANALNQWRERHLDAKMERTWKRPLPAGKLHPRHALIWGVGTALAGVVVLAAQASLPTAGLALGVVLLYVLVYTPLKTRSTLCTLAGAVCGAIPPLIGWAAAGGRLTAGAWLLAGLLFSWQIPHFFALAWLHRRDYARCGFKMLPVVDSTGHLTFHVLLLFALALLPLGLSMALVGLTGPVFAFGSLALGGIWLVLAVRLYRRRTAAAARHVFLSSLVILPLLLGGMVVDRAALVRVHPGEPPKAPVAPAQRLSKELSSAPPAAADEVPVAPGQSQARGEGGT